MLLHSFTQNQPLTIKSGDTADDSVPAFSDGMVPKQTHKIFSENLDQSLPS